MMTTNPATVVTGAAATGGGEPWREELEQFLRPEHFPARLDQLLATLARRHAPSRVYWRLASLPLSRTFDGLADLTAALEVRGHLHAAPEPI